MSSRHPGGLLLCRKCGLDDHEDTNKVNRKDKGDIKNV